MYENISCSRWLLDIVYEILSLRFRLVYIRVKLELESTGQMKKMFLNGLRYPFLHHKSLISPLNVLDTAW